MGQAIEKLRKRLRDRTVDLAQEIHREIVERCPYLTGQAKSDWYLVPFDQLDGVTATYLQDGETIPRDEAEAISISQAQWEAEVAKGEGITHLGITNKLHYIPELEAGKSWRQAPNGFIRLGVLAVLARRGNAKG